MSGETAQNVVSTTMSPARALFGNLIGRKKRSIAIGMQLWKTNIRPFAFFFNFVNLYHLFHQMLSMVHTNYLYEIINIKI